MPERALRIVAAHPGPDRYGSDRMLVRSVKAFVDRGHSVTVVLPGDGPLVPHLDDTGADVVFDPFPVLRKDLLRPGALLRAGAAAPAAVARARRLLRRLEPDLVYASTLTLPHWLAAARWNGTPAVCHVREAEDDAHPAVAAALVAPLALATAVVANSSHTAAFVRRHAVGRRPQVTVVHNGMEFPPARSRRGTAASPPGPARLTVVGRLNPRKGQDLAIAALRLLRDEGRDVELGLVGDTFPGYGSVEEALRSQARELGVDAFVRFHGYRDDVGRVLDESDVVLVPSRLEPLGNVAIEAMGAGRPVVAADVGGLREIVMDGVTGRLVPPGDPAALAGAVGELLDDPALAASLASSGAVDARSRFSFDRYAKELVAAVERAAAPPPPEAAGRRRVLTVVVDKGFVGGLERSVVHAAGELSRQGVDLEAAVLVPHRAPAPAAHLLAEHVPTERAPDARSLWRAVRRADVVHVHAPTALCWPAPVVALAGLARTPVVLTLHLPSSPPPRASRIGRARMQLRFVGRGLLLRAAGADVRSPSAGAAELARRRFRPVPVAVGTLANGVPDPGWAPVDTAPGPLRAVFVGALEPRKRPDLFVEAVALARRGGADVEGLLAGDGPCWTSLFRLVDALGAPVRLVGSVSDAGALMAEADLLVLPSVAEGGAPLVVQEAAARGRASVARTSLQGMSDWYGACVTVPDAAGAEAFAAVIARLAGDRHELRRLGAAARARFEDGFTSAQAAARLRAVYEAGVSARDPA